ncbi:uncharacterized protein METZ01_LOCUS75801 [marine metagenome]|uniref:Uncharacterized protein n=1 Tax=marine metagenome TaxID=408172 RepID=A0A381U6I0_9ZZZZ
MKSCFISESVTERYRNDTNKTLGLIPLPVEAITMPK